MIKKIIIAIVALIILLIVAVGVFLATFDLNHYREFTEKKLSLLLNRPVQIGAMHTKLSFIPTIEISNFEILDSKENPKPIIQIPRMDATLEIVPLIKNFQIDIQKINVLLISADLTNLTYNKKSKEQEEKQKEAPKKEQEQGKEAQNVQTKKMSDLDNLWVKNIVVNKVLVRFMNGENKDAIEFENLTIKDLNNLRFQINYHKKNFNVDGSVGALTKLMIEQKELPINLKIKQGTANLTLKGQIGDLPKMEKIKLNATLNISKFKTFLKGWNIDLPNAFDTSVATKFYLDGNLKKMQISNFETSLARETFTIKSNGEILNLKNNPKMKLAMDINLKDGDFSKKINLNPIELTADFEINSNSLKLDNLLFRSGHSDLSGDFQIDWTKTPTIRPNFKSSYLDLKDIFKERIPSKKQTKTEQRKTNNISLSWQKRRVNWDWMKKFNISGKIDIDHLFVTNLITNYIGISAEIQMNNGILNSAVQSEALSGHIDASLRLDATQQSAELKLLGEDLNLDKIRAIYPHVHDAHINTEILLTTKGKTFKELFSNADGKIVTELLEGGVIVDKWFNSLPLTLNAAKRKTDFLDFSTTDNKTEILCAAINLPIRKGVLLSDNSIAMQTPALSIVLDGSINMKNETLDLRLIPSTDNSNQLLNLTQFIQITGPWNKPSWRLDKKAIVSNLLNKDSSDQAKNNSKFGLCEKALGRKVNMEHPNKMRQKPSKSTPKQQQKPQENFKDLLRKSLSPIFTQAAQ